MDRCFPFTPLARAGESRRAIKFAGKLDQVSRRRGL